MPCYIHTSIILPAEFHKKTETYIYTYIYVCIYTQINRFKLRFKLVGVWHILKAFDFTSVIQTEIRLIRYNQMKNYQQNHISSYLLIWKEVKINFSKYLYIYIYIYIFIYIYIYIHTYIYICICQQFLLHFILLTIALHETLCEFFMYMYVQVIIKNNISFCKLSLLR